MADKRENEMQNGTPVKLRGLDAGGNSITPSLQNVIEALPGERYYGNGLYYCLPKRVLSLSKPV